LFFEQIKNEKNEKNEIKGERRERLPAQRGKESNSTRALSSLAGNRAMLVFLK